MLKERILTAIVAGTVLLVVLYLLPAAVAEAVLVLLILAAAWEWSAFVAGSGVPPRVGYVALVGALLLLAYLYVDDAESISTVLRFGLAWWFAALIWVFFYPTPIPRALSALCGVLVLLPAYVALLVLFSHAPSVLLSVLIVVWAADIGAYFTGKRFGRIKLAPSISPGKTWEGVIGGLCAVVIVLLAVRAAGLDIDIAVVIPFGLAVAMLSIVGDLTVSMFKRNAGLKDSGRLFPGHGGLLDRIDSVTAAAPLFALGIGWTGLV